MSDNNPLAVTGEAVLSTSVAVSVADVDRAMRHLRTLRVVADDEDWINKADIRAAECSLLAALQRHDAEKVTLRDDARGIVDSYTLCMVGTGAQEYIDACADDVIQLALGWPVTYKTHSRRGPSQ